MDNKVKVTIDGKEVLVPSEYTVLKAATEAGVHIPRLCFLEGIHEEASCRVCVVNIEGMRGLKNSCTVKVFDGMSVVTKSKEITNSVRYNLQLLAANHTFECWACPREHNCEFLDLLREFKIEDVMGEDPQFHRKARIINESPALVIDSSKCVLCGRCVSACEKLAGAHVLDFNNRGNITFVGPAANHSLDDSGCIYCGACVQACPVGALKEKDEIEVVEDYLVNPTKYVVSLIAPEINVALGEEFNLPYGTNVEGKIINSLELLGFDQTVNTGIINDYLVDYEANKIINGIKDNTEETIFTSFSPSWIRWVEMYKPELIDQVSKSKSPLQLMGSTIKNHFSNLLGVDKEDIITVALSPDLSSKYEASLEKLSFDGVNDIDVSLTTRELAKLIKRAKIDFTALNSNHKLNGDFGEFNNKIPFIGTPTKFSSELIKKVYKNIENKDLEKVSFKKITDDILEYTLNVNNIKLNFAVVSGGAAMKEFVYNIYPGKKHYHFVEVHGNNYGNIMGGGQPIVKAEVRDAKDIAKIRTKALDSLEVKLDGKDIQAELFTKEENDFIKGISETNYTEKEIFNL